MDSCKYSIFSLVNLRILPQLPMNANLEKISTICKNSTLFAHQGACLFNFFKKKIRSRDFAATMTLFRLGFLGVPGTGKGGGGGGGLHKSESIDAIVMKLGGQVEHYYLISFNRLHAIMTS